MNKTIVIEKKNGKRESYVVRQAEHDKPMKIGGKLFGGVIVEIRTPTLTRVRAFAEEVK